MELSDAPPVQRVAGKRKKWYHCVHKDCVSGFRHKKRHLRLHSQLPDIYECPSYPRKCTCCIYEDGK